MTRLDASWHYPPCRVRNCCLGVRSITHSSGQRWWKWPGHCEFCANRLGQRRLERCKDKRRVRRGRRHDHAAQSRCTKRMRQLHDIFQTRSAVSISDGLTRSAQCRLDQGWLVPSVTTDQCNLRTQFRGHGSRQGRQQPPTFARPHDAGQQRRLAHDFRRAHAQAPSATPEFVALPVRSALGSSACCVIA